MQTSRLFFGLSLQAPWPESWPKGRVLAEEDRHLTLAFLGDVLKKDIDLLQNCPKPTWFFSPCGLFDSCHLLPEKKNPRVLAWHLEWEDQEVKKFQNKLTIWLREHHFSLSEKPWLSHVTVSRAPFDEEGWFCAFRILPCYIKAFHLFESLGHSQYRSLWIEPFQVPFEEIEHTADIAFLVYGKDLVSLYRHAVWALAFTFPSFLVFAERKLSLSSLDEVIIALNEALGRADAKVGCPFKAVSFHGEIEQKGENFIQWEMIVDV